MRVWREHGVGIMLRDEKGRVWPLRRAPVIRLDGEEVHGAFEADDVEGWVLAAVKDETHRGRITRWKVDRATGKPEKETRRGRVEILPPDLAPRSQVIGETGD